MELGLVAVLATQLWHHTYIDPTLCSLPDWRSIAGVEAEPRDLAFAAEMPESAAV
jgi:asparagine synthase (glutamine-hydrolysing)